MRVAFLSDPHGDHVALMRVIADLETAGAVDEVLLGGDLAQGGAQPSQVVDEVRARGWRSVRGNADDLLVRIAEGRSVQEALRPARETHETLPASTASHAEWSVGQLGPERIEYLRTLPMSIELGPFEFGTVMLVHATPWSTEDVVLPDADEKTMSLMVSESRARLVVYGHIHTPYQRRVGDAGLMSVGGISGSNDADARPAYSIVSLASAISVEVRRVDWPAAERREAYQRAGVDEKFNRDRPGPFPVRSQPGVPVTVWP